MISYVPETFLLNPLIKLFIILTVWTIIVNRMNYQENGIGINLCSSTVSITSFLTFLSIKWSKFLGLYQWYLLNNCWTMPLRKALYRKMDIYLQVKKKVKIINLFSKSFSYMQKCLLFQLKAKSCREKNGFFLDKLYSFERENPPPFYCVHCECSHKTINSFLQNFTVNATFFHLRALRSHYNWFPRH